MSKHAYTSNCACKRCERERTRRLRERNYHATRRLDPQREQRAPWGSQEWAETRGDDLGESPDF